MTVLHWYGNSHAPVAPSASESHDCPRATREQPLCHAQTSDLQWETPISHNAVYISCPALRVIVEQFSGRGFDSLSPRAALGETGLSKCLVLTDDCWWVGGLSNCWALLLLHRWKHLCLFESVFMYGVHSAQLERFSSKKLLISIPSNWEPYINIRPH